MVDVLSAPKIPSSLSITPRMTARVPYEYPRARTKGVGYLAGEFPGGITTVDGVPNSVAVRVLLRAPAGHPSDGDVIAEIQSAPDGTWRASGLDASRRYDVVVRKTGFNDAILTDITPAID